MNWLSFINYILQMFSFQLSRRHIIRYNALAFIVLILHTICNAFILI